MNGSVALDVAIGLIFIFLLYSLLASVIGEIIAIFLGLRARNLAHAICRMLEDEREIRNPVYNNKFILFWIGLFNSVKYLLLGKRGGKAYRTFYNHPAVKYMAINKFYSKPSYLTAETFSKVMLDILKMSGKDGGSEEIDKVKKALDGGEADVEKLKAIDRILQHRDEKTALNSIKVIMNRQEGSHLLRGESRWFVASLLDDAQNDLVKFRYLLEKWFDQTMERASGWYKRTLQFLLLLIGFILALTFNANTLSIINVLSKDKDAREKMVQLAIAHIENQQTPAGTGNNGLQESTPVPAAPSTPPATADSVARENAAATQKLDSLQTIRKQLENDIREANSIMGMGWDLPNPLPLIKLSKRLDNPERQNLILIRERPGEFLYIHDLNWLDPQAVRASIDTVVMESNSVYLKTTKYRKKHFLDLRNIIGYLLTALAISLGAPFWFDLLNKLVQIRTSVQPHNRSKTDGREGVKGSGVPPDKRVG